MSYFNAGGTLSHICWQSKRHESFKQFKRGSGICAAVTKGNYTMTVDNCIVNEFKRQGITMKGANLTAQISNNTILTGFPNPVSTVIEGGIKFLDFATGSIMNNTVSYIISSQIQLKQCPGIYAKSGDNLIVSGNTVSNSDIGISCEECGVGLNIENNICSNNNIGIQCRLSVDKLLIQKNQCNDNKAGIYLHMTKGQSSIVSHTLTNNQINGMLIFNDSKENSFVITDNVLIKAGPFPIQLDGGLLDSNIPYAVDWGNNQFSDN